MSAAAWEERLYRAAHPIAYPLLTAVRSPVRRIPGLGIVVTDAALLRSVLLDGRGFTKNGPGASSELWTPVLGPTVLVNMDGADHAALRRQLAPCSPRPGWMTSPHAPSPTRSPPSPGDCATASPSIW